MNIECTRNISLVAPLDEQHIVSCDDNFLKRKIRCWKVDHAMEIGNPMDGIYLRCISVSKDGKWIANGTSWGGVKVWDASNYTKAIKFKAHGILKQVCVMDISPHNRIATGSTDKKVYVWALKTGERLIGPLRHDNEIAAVKFSPDGRFLATATWQRPSAHIYDANDGRLLFHLPISVASQLNQSLAWAVDSGSLFILSSDGHIHRHHATSGTSLSKWLVQRGNNRPKWIGLASNGTFIVAGTDFSVSFWDPMTPHQQIGSTIDHVDSISSFAILADRKIAMAIRKKIIFHDIPTVPEIPAEPPSPHPPGSGEVFSKLGGILQDFRNQLNQDFRDKLEQMKDIQSSGVDLHAHEPNNDMVHLDETAQEPDEVATNVTRTADLRTEPLDTAIRQIRTVIQTLDASAERETAHKQRRQCEDLYKKGNIRDSAVYLTDFVNTMSDDLKSDKKIVEWAAEFENKCATDLEKAGDVASADKSSDKALKAYTAALSLPSLPTRTLPIKWAKSVMTRGSWRHAWNEAAKLKSYRFHGSRAICEVLEDNRHRVKEAVQYFRRMQTELSGEPHTREERERWEPEFRERCSKKLEEVGDSMMELKDYNEAIAHYSHALSLPPLDSSDVVVKCCTARKRLLEGTLAAAEKDIKLAPSSYKGYERKHFALHNMGCYKEAFMAFENMLKKLEESPDPGIHALRDQYFNATPKIREIVQNTIRDIPVTLINTVTGRLCNKAQQERAFEEFPTFNQLRSSMIMKIDEERIRREVSEFYRYVMFSHRWQSGEATFQEVEKATVYKLAPSPVHAKLVRFCRLVRHLHFLWAWNDTCCINAVDKGTQQEAVVAMFRWYRDSSLTIIHLLGVSKDESVRESIWNTRGWTYQEYVASKVVQFYTEDWQPYRGLNMFNHKESPFIISEMEQDMGMGRQELSTLRPGPTRAREKLYLASGRKTTREEDIAYCLFGIFGVAQPVIYGEGKQVAVSRLLEHILARSGDTTILAWTGTHGSQSSYLPADLTVYDQIVPRHLPPTMNDGAVDDMVTSLDPSDRSLALSLYHRLRDLTPLSVSAGRLRLPGIVFQLFNVGPPQPNPDESSQVVYRAKSPMLGDVEIKTTDRSISEKGLLLIHPWISPLLDQEFPHDLQSDLERHARRLVVRLRQKFGALLLSRVSHSQYRRVATDCFIAVQVRKEAGLDDLMAGVQTVDVQ